MALASANRAEISIAPETVIGTLQPLFYDTAVIQRMTGETLSNTLTYSISDEIRSDRQSSGLIQTQASASGDMNIEWSAKSYTPLLESLFSSVFSPSVALYAVSDAAITASNTITSVLNLIDITNLVSGQWIKITGAATTANNKYVQVSKTITPLVGVLVLEGAPLTNVTETLNITESQKIRLGTTEKSFSVIETFNDTTPVTYFTFVGMRVSKLSLSFSVGSALSGSFSFIGESASVSTTVPTGTLASQAPASTTNIMNSVSDMANIWLDGVISTSFFNKLTVDIDGTLREQQALGKLGSVGIGQGRFVIGGSISVYFADITLYNKYINATSFSLSFSVDDGINAFIFTMGNCKFDTSSVNATGNDTDVLMDGTYKASLDTVTSTLQIDKFE